MPSWAEPNQNNFSIDKKERKKMIVMTVTSRLSLYQILLQEINSSVLYLDVVHLALHFHEGSMIIFFLKS